MPARGGAGRRIVADISERVGEQTELSSPRSSSAPWRWGGLPHLTQICLNSATGRFSSRPVVVLAGGQHTTPGPIAPDAASCGT